MTSELQPPRSRSRSRSTRPPPAEGKAIPDAVTIVDLSARGLGDGFVTTAAGESDDEPGAIRMSIGRYPILRRLGAGGMGVVYAAYDELLDRRLAIKVLHDRVWDIDGRRRERLLREAQALARVTHPNVITVHEVGTADDQLFMVMEFVAGPTLREWLIDRQPGWREIVAVFRQIAEGLAALHDAGLVHRDVKPTNMIIGDDGRVRVLDLGLVAAGAEEEPEEEPASQSVSFDRIEGALTMTGERLGTPAYMSREQFLGLALTPASDIFSLCVALYEALHGVHPFLFGAGSFHALQANVVEGRIAPPPPSSAVPAWLHNLTLSGLAADPRDRPASMRALAAALGRDPGRVRRRWIGTVAVAVLAAITAVLVTRAQITPLSRSCDGAEDAIATIWSRERARAIRAAMVASERPYAAALAERITEELERYADDWVDAHRRSCRDHARGEHSAALLDARMACLDRRRQAFAETVEILVEADAEVVEHAGRLVARLPRLAPCDDLAALADRRPAVELRSAGALASLESRLVRAETLVNAGRREDATTLVRAIAREAEALEQPAILAAALLAEARAALVLQSDRAATRELLDRALRLAIEHGLDAIAAEAMILRLYARGLTRGGSEAALADLPLAEAMLARAGDDPELGALLLNNAGTVQLAAGEGDAARAAFERSLAIKERLYGADHLELALGLANLGMLTADAEARRVLHGRMIEIYEHRLGPEHPRTLDARLLASFFTADPQRASELLDELCPRLLAADDPYLAGECELERGRLALAHDRGERARSSFELARARLGEDERRRILIAAYLGLAGAEPGPVIAELRGLITAADRGRDGEDWWSRLEQAERRVLLARLLLETGEVVEGVADLERAIVELEGLEGQAQAFDRDRLLADARYFLVLALTESTSASASAVGRAGSTDSQTRARIAALAGAARSFYSRWPRTYAGRLERLRHTHSTQPSQQP